MVPMGMQLAAEVELTVLQTCQLIGIPRKMQSSALLACTEQATSIVHAVVALSLSFLDGTRGLRQKAAIRGTKARRSGLLAAGGLQRPRTQAAPGGTQLPRQATCRIGQLCPCNPGGARQAPHGASRHKHCTHSSRTNKNSVLFVMSVYNACASRRRKAPAQRHPDHINTTVQYNIFPPQKKSLTSKQQLELLSTQCY